MKKKKTSISELMEKFTPLTVKAVWYGLITTFLWIIIPQEKIADTAVDAESIKFALEIMFLSHSVLAAWLTTLLFQKITVLKGAVRKGEPDEIEEVVDFEIPEPIDYLLLILSTAIFLLSILKPTDSIAAGSILSFSGVFIVAIWWNILHELDDPYNGVCSIDGLEELEKNGNNH